MKNFLRIFLPLAVLAAALTACGPDQPKNNPEIEKYVAAHPYVAALGDDAPVLVKLQPLALFEKSGFAKDPEFALLREELLGDTDAMTRMMVENVMNDFTVLGLDPKNPIYFSVSNIDYSYEPRFDSDPLEDSELSADIYGVLPLTDREKLISYIVMANEDFKADEEGRYLFAMSDAGFLIAEKAVIFYFGLDRNRMPDEVKQLLLDAEKKQTLINLRPGAGSFFTRNDDISLWADAAGVKGELEEFLQQVSGEFQPNFQDLLGGDIFAGTAGLISLNSYPGKVELRAESFGSNALSERVRSWVAVPNRDRLDYLPTKAQLAFTFAFSNLSDALAYTQEVLERSGEAEGVNLPSVLGAFGVEPQDLDGIGTVVGGVKVGDGTISWIVALEVGDKLLETAETGVAFLELAEDPDYPEVYLAGDDTCLRLIDGIIFVGSQDLIFEIGPGGLFGEDFLHLNPIADDMGYMALALDDPIIFAPFEDEDLMAIGTAVSEHFRVLNLAKEPGCDAIALTLHGNDNTQGIKALLQLLIETWGEFDTPFNRVIY